MELENTNAAMQPDEIEVPLSEPHFDDEATLLSAQPVVPLDEVEPAGSRLPRGWLLAATVFAAMFLGALGSAVYLSIVNREPAASAFESEALTGGVAGEVGDSPSTNQPPSEANAQVIPDSDQEITDSEPAKENNDDDRKPAARRVAVLTYPSSREERKAARRLAKERKRELERQDRRARDLTRIREIFEGTQRPQ